VTKPVSARADVALADGTSYRIARGGHVVTLPAACAHCGEPIEHPVTGRPRRYCSGTCRTAGYRYGDPCPRGRVDRWKWCRHPRRRAE
jgi:hypothetical protein